MERFQQLKNGILNINQWKLDIRRSYQEYEQLTSELETLVSKKKTLVSNRDDHLRVQPDHPEWHRITELESDISHIQEEENSLPKFERQEEHVEVFTDNRITIAEMLIYALSGYILLRLFEQFFRYGIPQSISAPGNETLVDGIFTLMDVVFVLAFLSPLIYILVRRSISPCIKRGVSIVELPAVFCLWFASFCLAMSLDVDSRFVTENSLGGRVIVFLIFLLLSFGGLVIVAKSQSKKYYATSHSLKQAVVEQRKAVWNEDNSEVLDRRKELDSAKKLASDEIKVIRKKNTSFSNHNEKLIKFTKSIEKTNSSIEKTSSKISEKLSSILKLEQNVESTWSSIEPMIPKSELG